MPPAHHENSPLARIHRLLASRAFFLVLGALATAFVVLAGFDASTPRPSDGTIWRLGRADLEVHSLVDRSDAASTPLRPSDGILGINHKMIGSPAAAAEQLKSHTQEIKRQPAGVTVSYLILRGGEQMEVAVPLTLSRVIGPAYLINVLLTVIYLGIGILVYMRSNNERPARLFFLLCLLFGMYFMTNVERSSYFWGDVLTQNIGAFTRFMLPPLFLHFFLVFPQEKRFLTRHPFLAPFFYLVPAVLYVRFSLDQFLALQGAQIGPVTWILLGLYYVGGLLALLHGYFSYRDPLLRERVRILTLGTLAAVIPFLVFKIGLEELSARAGLAHLGVVPLAAIPVSFGYCVARYQLLQVDLLVKRSLMYGFLTAALLVGYLAVVFGVGWRILKWSGSTNELVSVGIVLAIAAVLWPLRSRCQRALERRFYRSRTALSEVLEEISQEIPRLIQRDVLLEKVGGRLVDVLNIPQLAVYVPQDATMARWRLAGSVSHPDQIHRNGRLDRAATQDIDNQEHPVPVTPGGAHLYRPAALLQTDATAPPPRAAGATIPLPRNLDLEATVRTIRERGEPFWIDPEAEEPGLTQAITREQVELELRISEQRRMAEAGITLLVPMISGERLIGLVTLPAKPGGETYPLHEIRLLTIVAGQVALQIENTRLYEEEVTKQKLEEEMAMARAIQSRLLPNRLPELEGVDIHAANVSSKLVSGDYYDMIEREDGRLAIIIADVSGKGMPASLLASNLQAALRAQCDTEDSPGRILSRINRQMHATTDPQHFATLFLCFFDPATRQLVYSSGGHNAPVVLRATGEAELLEKGGLPLGAFDFGDYEEGEVYLDAGDLLFLYTDGLTETRDIDQVLEFGEERLNSLLRENRTLSACELIARIHEELRSFRGKDETDDDITLISLKVEATAREASAQVGII